MGSKIQLFAQGKSAGFVQQFGEHPVLMKFIKNAAQRLRVPPAYACDQGIIKAAVNKYCCSAIVIFDKERKLLLGSMFPEFQKKSFIVDRGFGRQQALPIESWEIILSPCSCKQELISKNVANWLSGKSFARQLTLVDALKGGDAA